jgi:hypothetical protein
MRLGLLTPSAHQEIKMNAYDRWLEEPYDSSWREEDEGMEFCQDEYLTEDELMEEQYALHCFLNDVSDE